ncbi:VWA domain-containing protein [candidate division KSB1 bacterium]|nr:VWA domain-containing protein [candidate division KSB1 bacterium]NIR73004.1 VWA domain-containing protein [candidate division KSB1 bacterium]NIS28278.1 VWA domain-containing protein [candidate division KSB1 bacterium]NIT75150.1 VWA domain-containing protein [candidate division KSB1 bacterium]NIU28957.1 VWA domain-containing protein [candidate division KSB1 bacterium]
MIFRYSEWREGQDKSKLTFDELMRLFSQMLLHTNGDVNDALHWMTDLDDKYQLFDDKEGVGFDEFLDWLKKEGYLQEYDDILALTHKGSRRIRQDALNEIFSSLRKSPMGEHESPFSGEGIERLSETKPYKFGDQPSNIDFTSTINNAIKREGIDDFHLKEEDFEVYETEHLTSCATVLMLDISHSMILYGEDRITPAKKVALALSEMILTRYPKDSLDIVVFGDKAMEVNLQDIHKIAVGPYHTNTKDALELGLRILKKKRNVNKQVFMITDGKPSAIFDRGRLFKNPFGLDRKIVNQTLNAARHCRKNKITITTFMVARDPWLVDFVKELTEVNKGRAYYSSLNKLGEYIFVDYIRNRKQRLR